MSDTPVAKSFNFSGSTTRRASGSVFFFLNNTKIRCLDELDGLTFFEFAETAGSAFGADGSTENVDMRGLAGAAGAVIGLLRSAIVDEDWEPFVKAVKAPGSGVGPEQLAEILGWLVEQYTETPTQ